MRVRAYELNGVYNSGNTMELGQSWFDARLRSLSTCRAHSSSRSSNQASAPIAQRPSTNSYARFLIFGGCLPSYQMPLLKFLPCLLLVVLWLGSVQRVTACSCMPTHPQTAFCRSDFTAVVRVKSVREVDDTSVEYKVKFHKVFKSSAKFEKVREQGSLWSGGNSAMCGVDLEVGTSYVISGNVYDDKARVSLCNVIRQWSTVTSRQRKAYRQFYRYHCGCEVTYTSWSRKGAVYDTIGGKQCLWESMPGPQKCQEEYGVCIKGPVGCTWKPTVAYKTCIKEHQLNRDSQRQKEP